MSDIRLLRPAAGTNQAVACEPEANFVFEFPTDAATLSRSGDDLVMTFEDGATLSLMDFYKTYSSDNMPSFDVGGSQVAGADFFTAMNEPDLMPAAGPGGNTAPGGGRYHEYANMALYDGLDRLGGLDVGWPDGGYEPELEGGAGDDAGLINATPSLDNFTTTPEDDGRNPNAAGTGSAGIMVDEASYAAAAKEAGQSNTGGAGSGDRGHGYKGRGGFDVHLNGEGGTVTLTDPEGNQVTFGVDREGNVSVQQGDGLTVNGVLVNDFSGTVDGEGTLHVEYKYALEESRTHGNANGVGTDDALRGQIGIHVVDGNGDTADGSLSVEVHDDGPVLSGITVTTTKLPSNEEADGSKDVIVVDDVEEKIQFTLDGANWGADQGEGAQITVTVCGKTYTWTKDANGGWERTAEGNDLEYDPATNTFTYTRPESDVQDPAKEGSSPDSDSYTFNVQITDSDGDSASQEVTVKTVGTPGFTNPEDTPDPDPKPDPDPEHPSTHLGTARTDDSYVPEQKDEAGKVTQPKGTMAGQDGQPETGLADNDNAKSHTDAHGRFGVTLNGDKYTLEVTGEGESADRLTLYLDENGKVTHYKLNDKEKTPWPENDGVTVQGVYGDLTITEDAEKGGEFKYTYTQKKSYDHRHGQGDSNSRDEVAEGAEHFNVTVQDQHEHTLNGHIDVSIEDDEPTLSGITVTTTTLTPNEEADGKGAIVVDDANTAIQFKLEDAALGADQGEGAQVTVTVGNETYTWTRQEGKWEASENCKGTLDYDAEKGTFTYTRPADDVQKDETEGNSSPDSNSYTFKVEIKDSDGDTKSSEVTVKTVGTPEFTDQEETPDPDPKPDPDPEHPSTHLGTARTDDSYVPEQKDEAGKVTQPKGTMAGQDGQPETGLADNDNAKSHTDAHGRFGVTLNGDKYTLEVTGEGESADRLTLYLDENGKVTHYKLNDEGQTPWPENNDGLTVHGVYGDLTITQTSPGEFSYTYTQKKNYDHSHGQGDSNPRDEVAEGAEHFNVTVQDQHEHTLNGHIDVNIEDDEPVYSEWHVNDVTTHKGVQKSLDFVLEDGSPPTNKWSDFRDQNTAKGQHWGDDKPDDKLTYGTDYKAYDENTGNNLHWGVNNGIKIIPTAVEYTADSTVKDVSSSGWSTGDLDDTHSGQEDEYTYGKTLWLTDEGLGVGNDDGPGKHEISGQGRNAEAIVLEVNNGAVSYGLDITFDNFESDDKVLISFYLTPRNNGDNDLVKQYVVSSDDLQSGHFIRDLPDGFNKVIISPLPKNTDIHSIDQQTKDYSSFTIKQIDITRNSYVHSGKITFEEGADGLTEAGVTWNWDSSNLNGSTVNVTGTAGAGAYTVRLVYTGNTVTAYLEGGSGDINLKGNILFTGTLNANTGEWEIERFYNFTMDNGSSREYDVTFSVTDNDGDTVTSSRSIDLSTKDLKDRFDNVETGYWNYTETDDTKKWSDANSALDDLAADVLIGGDGGNDLMFGKGGTDVLFGDGSKDALEEAVAKFLGETSSVDFKEITGLAKQQSGENDTLVEALYTKLKDTFNNSSDSALKELLQAVEGSNGGDDALFGGQCDDILFGGAGNDYLNGGPGLQTHDGKRDDTDNDIIFGGSGNDIILYGEGDLIHGGDDVDILLANSSDEDSEGNNLTLESDGIKDVEVLLQTTDGTDVRNLGITSSADLAKYGIEMDGDTLYLTKDWGTPGTDGKYHYTTKDGHTLDLTVQEGMDVTANCDLLPSQRPTDDPTQDQPDEPIPDPTDDLSPDSTDDPADTQGQHTISSSPDSSLKFVADVSSLKDSQDDDPLSVEDDLNGSTGSDTLFADSGNDYLSGSDSLSAGDELIQYDPTDYAVFGGDGFDVLLSNDKDTDSLEDLLKAPLGGDKPHVQDVELFLKGDNVEDLASMDDLQKYGITVDEENGTVTLGEGWSGSNGTYTNAENGLTLETTLSEVTPQGVDEAAQQAANQIQLTQQG